MHPAIKTICAYYERRAAATVEGSPERVELSAVAEAWRDLGEDVGASDAAPTVPGPKPVRRKRKKSAKKSGAKKPADPPVDAQPKK